MSSICKFLPLKEGNQGIQTVYFVYESEHHKLRQPFINAVYYLYLVTKGEGSITLLEKKYPLKAGTLFLVYPGYSYTMSGSDDFAYMYISFMGGGVESLIGNTVLGIKEPSKDGFEHLVPFWKSSIARISSENANMLTEGVLLYTLSFLTETEASKKQGVTKNLVLDNVVRYVDNHYTDKDLTLKKIAGIFSYSEKYLSALFKRNMNMNFTEYLNKQRITNALRCIEWGITSVAEISESCGFSDPLYFSKVFKKAIGLSPKEYAKLHYTNKIAEY